ncbi:ATP-binding protein [Exiguobacterium sp. s193]|uniref:sensor histidine kinase n=1 Tax=Exiguobacterium sp. s193 TaxID=2751207 RepID=UPI001BE8D624|nr:ATP-binding protein [Exiguobacterium sp. s193]
MLEVIRKRLTLLFSGTFLLLLILILVGVYFTTARLLDQTELNQLKNISNRDVFERIEHGEDRLTPNPIYFQVLDETGEEQYSNLPDDVKEETVQRFVSSAQETEKVTVEDHHFLLYQRNTKEGSIVLLKETSATRDTLQRLIAILSGIAVLSTLVLMGVSYVLAGRAVQPVQQAFDRQRRFTSDASHELRTPLTILYSGIELLESEPLSREGQTILADLKAETTSMQLLVADLLLLARGGQSVTLQSVDFSALVSKTAERFAHTLPNRTLRIEIESNLSIKGDTNQLTRLLMVFLENASVYSDGAIEVRLLKAPGEVQLTIADEGIGIPKSDQSKIFERFYRGDHARHGTGTGLGLAIASSIADAHGAKIELDSALNEGTRFTIHFPH